MSRQHGIPYVISEDRVHRLEPVTGIFNEKWVQNFIFTHHQAMPIYEIEPVFGPLIPVCRELRTKVGPVDMLFINQTGLLTLVECKLWQNPEARREVVGQILDYAKEVSRWSYADLQKAISGAQEGGQQSLYKLVSERTEEIDESDFVDSVSRNLRRGRVFVFFFCLGIRKNVEQIADFLQQHAHLNFSFALVELGIFKLPNHANSSYFIQPRVITQTVEIERAVVRIEDGQITAEVPTEARTEAVAGTKRTKISEQVFFEDLHADEQTANELRSFLDEARDIGLYVEPGQNSLKLKSQLFDFNFGVFRVQGDFRNHLRDIEGYPQIGESYLSRLAELFDEGFIYKIENRFWWTVKIGDRYLTISEVLAVKDRWLKIIRETLDEIAKAQEN
jgi:hypothetical protein